MKTKIYTVTAFLNVLAGKAVKNIYNVSYNVLDKARYIFIASNKTDLLNMVQSFLAAKLGVSVKGDMIQKGNRKIGPNTLAINQETAHECSSLKKKFCKVGARCYALKDERLYKTYYNANKRRARFFAAAGLEDYLLLIRTYVATSAKKIRRLRLNEAGDFRTQAGIKFWSVAAEKLKKEFNIITYAYTARKDLNFEGVNFVLCGSNFDIRGAHKYFLATEKADFNNLPAGAMKCNGNCVRCSNCYNSRPGVIYCKMH